MTNEQLAHELLLDLTFQLDESGCCSVEKPVFHSIRESFHTAFWDSLVDDFTLAHPCYLRVLRVLCKVRDGISDLAGSRTAAWADPSMRPWTWTSSSSRPMRGMDFIQQQADAGLYGWDSCRQLMVTHSSFLSASENIGCLLVTWPLIYILKRIKKNSLQQKRLQQASE